MLRFSDSKLGAISTAYYIKNEHTQDEICHLEPDTQKILTVRSLADMVKDFSYLKFLYPDKDKAEVFGKYYSAKQVAEGNYVKKTLVAHIDT